MKVHHKTPNYVYKLYKVKQEYELVDKGSLIELSDKYSFANQSAYQAWKAGRILYGKYFIKRERIN